MKLNRLLSVFTAAVVSLPCMYIPQVSALSSELFYYFEEDEHDIYIPDFPQEVLDAFDIDWTGLGFNRNVEPTEFTIDGAHHKFTYDGGYAMYGHQNELRTMCVLVNWYDCNSFSASQTKDYPTPEFFSYNHPKLSCRLNCDITKEGELTAGTLLTLNGGKDELFIIEKHTDSTAFPEEEKIGSYSSEYSEYTLYKEASGDDSVSRYYAVNSASYGPFTEYCVDINDHLSALSENGVKVDTLDKYTSLVCGKEGRGDIFFESYIKTDPTPLPSEKLVTDEEGHPYTYHNNIVKNLDGTYYSFRTSDSSNPITELEDGRYEITPHEDNSWFTPHGNGGFTTQVTDGMTSTVLAGKEYDDGTSLTDHNFRLNYEYSISDPDIIPSAYVWLTDPSRRYIFSDRKIPDYDSFNHYLGTISLPEGDFDLYGTGDSNLEISPDGERPTFEYLFTRHTDDTAKPEPDAVVKGSYPIYALIQAAEKFGVGSGNVKRITFGTACYSKGYKLDVIKNEIAEDAVSVLDQYDPANSYADVPLFDTVNLPPYSYSMSGNQDSCTMTARDNGCFTGKAMGKKSSFIANYNNKVTYDPYHDVIMKYKADIKMDGEHNLVYSLYIPDKKDYNVTRNVHIIEENNELPISERTYFFSGMGNTLTDDDFELIKTYEANGHKYDLYYNYSKYYGCFNTNITESYICVRKDQPKGTETEGTINLSEHLKQIDALAEKSIDLNLIELTITGTDGTAELLMNEVENPVRSEPQPVAGDINLDGCIDSLDVISAKKALISSAEPGKNLDVNKNGTFEIADVVLLQSYVLGKITSFPAE
ncbi:MAG: hypothetical protein BWZ04_02390 [Firmicutes bacterium ADurb.BinA205]|nr:MAG: hypothetical protein BWZ04_02390 [Firmicutes bacterium ADurb.BinA205]